MPGTQLPPRSGENRAPDSADMANPENPMHADIIQQAMLRRMFRLRDICILILAVLAVFYSLYFAAAIILPFVFAIVVNLLMVGPMRLLNGRLRVPKPLAALVLIAAMAALVAAIGLAISVPAAAWLARIPHSLPTLQAKFAVLHAPVHALQHLYDHLAILFHARTQGSPAQVGAEPATLTRIGSRVLLGTRTFMGEFMTMLLMLFFLMTEGDSLLRRIVEIMPTFADKRRIVQIATQIERNVSLYLATITIMNLAVGVLNFLQCWLTGMPNPLLWGVLAFLLNYVPIIGPLTGVVIYFLVGILAFPSIFYALLPPAIYLCIHIMEGETITPMLLAKRFTLNPVLVMASLMFWDWMWGIAGAFLSVPLLAVFKIFCDHIDALTPLGHLLGGPVRPRSLRTIGPPVSTTAPAK